MNIRNITKLVIILLYISINHLSVYGQITIRGNSLPPNESIYLDGINDYIEVKHHKSLNIYEDITIEAWIRPDSIGPEKTILIKGSSGQCENYGMFLKDGKLAFVSGGDCGWKGKSEKTIIKQGVWQHVAIVGIGNKVYFYLNGIQTDSISLYNTIGPINSESIWIGKSSGVLHNAYAGQIDDLRIWNYARTKKQINKNIFKEQSGNESGLVLYFSFSQEKQSPNNHSKLLIDNTKNKNDGLLYIYDKSKKTTNIIKSFSTSQIKTYQNYNEAIIEANNHFFISTLDGLNITNGINTKIYKQSTHNMIGNILQGDFYKDEDGNVWFTTYNALHKYMPEKDNFEVFQLPNSKGDTITSDYRLINHISNDKILLKLKHEMVIFDIKYKLIYKYFNIDFFNYSDIDAIINYDKQLFVAISNKKIKIIQKKDSLFITNWINILAESILLEKNNLWVGTSTGFLVQIDLESKKEISRKKIDDSRIMSIQIIDQNRLIITSKEQISIFNKQTKKIIERLTINHPITGEKLNYLLKPYIDKDSILWIGNDGLGVFSLNLKKTKFSHWKNLSFNNDNFQATQILESKYHKSYYICSRSNGLSKISSKGKILKEFGNSNKQSTGIKFACWKDSTSLIVSNFNDFLSFNIDNESFQKISLPFKKFSQINKDKKQNIFGSVSKKFLIRLKEDNGYWFYDTIALCPPNINNTIYTYFFFDNKNNLFIDNNLENILVFDSTHNNFLNKIEIDGGMLSLYDKGDVLLLTNYNGLYEINKDNFSHKQIIDDKKKLIQLIYGLLIDKKGFYWMSTNKGIYRYDPKTNQAHQFKPKDGLQEEEFNTMSYFENSKGEFMFGGINGINIFAPLKVKLSEKQATIDFYNYKINDEDSRQFGVSNYTEDIFLDYENNTISFEFVGIDYTDPQSVNLKYIMKGVDNDWVEIDENKGFARYSNLQTGKYTFKMLASNADEVWADQPKTVEITVLPPWWQTWWFRLLTLGSIAGVIHLSFLFYHRRKLREKDFQLREQKMLLEKQQALEAERTRIAGEMHDDLGGGLTTIRFLSQKVLKNIKNEANRSNIKKIVNHAQNLIINMSEIIWAMNAGFDTLDSLIAYTRRYTNEYLLEHNIKLKFETKGKTNDIQLSGEKRRNIFLITKEALHNIVKHAEASEAKMIFEVNNHLIVSISDNGKGFENENNNLGNGIRNMQLRCQNFGGKLTLDNENGVTIKVRFQI